MSYVYHPMSLHYPVNQTQPSPYKNPRHGILRSSNNLHHSVGADTTDWQLAITPWSRHLVPRKALTTFVAGVISVHIHRAYADQ